MKKAILIIGCFILILNILFGVLLSKYSYFNMGVNCGAIILNTALLFSIYRFSLRDAYRIMLSFLFVIVGIVEFILTCFMPQYWQDNGYLIAIINLFFIEISLFVVLNVVSNKIK